MGRRKKICKALTFYTQAILALADFDRALRDPNHPEALLPAYDSGDHLHPSPAGYRAMADAVPLAYFTP